VDIFLLNNNQKTIMKFVNPKIAPGIDPVDNWYRYYAGYSATFVEHAIAQVAPKASSILDPWNGTGTTTVVAANSHITGLRRESSEYDPAAGDR